MKDLNEPVVALMKPETAQDLLTPPATDDEAWAMINARCPHCRARRMMKVMEAGVNGVYATCRWNHRVRIEGAAADRLRDLGARLVGATRLGPTSLLGGQV